LEKADGAEPDEHILREESRELICLAMEKINPEYAAVLRLIYFEDMTPEEAARVMGKSKKQLANLTYRAKISLRRAMEEEGYSHEE
ncbi:MAG: sigma-70 family RNA polymerase sigma factor, partial [Clostridia bacterium]|nr:sigma-70 family RNA polymerase sigma factor [Clostridia bacterium]